MKKESNETGKPQQTLPTKRKTAQVTIGMDLGDKTSRYCLLDYDGKVVKEGKVATTKKGMGQTFGGMARCRIALEVGTHSPWTSRLLKSFGHEVIVANARQVKLISASSRKDDKLDAQMLARGAGRSATAPSDPTPERGSAAGSDVDPDSSRAARCTYGPGEYSPRSDQSGG